jgi:hypothetical protein
MQWPECVAQPGFECTVGDGTLRLLSATFRQSTTPPLPHKKTEPTCELNFVVRKVGHDVHTYPFVPLSKMQSTRCD